MDNTYTGTDILFGFVMLPAIAISLVKGDVEVVEITKKKEPSKAYRYPSRYLGRSK